MIVVVVVVVVVLVVVVVVVVVAVVKHCITHGSFLFPVVEALVEGLLDQMPRSVVW